MAVLELFETARQELSLTEIVARTDIGRSAAQRFVYSLHQLQYLSRNPETRRYSLGPKVLRLYRGYVGGRSMLQRAQPVLRQLNASTQECVSWVELAEHEIMVVESLGSPHVTSVTLVPGMRFEAVSASSGQVLLAHGSKAAAAAVFARAGLTARQRAGTADAAAFAQLLGRVRVQGYAMTEKAYDGDTLSISAPVLDVQGQAVGAINLSVPRTRFDRKAAMASLVPAVRAAARAASSG
jgi:IclR family pca regulon transcriptional regulator